MTAIHFCPQCGHPVATQIRYGKPRAVCLQCDYVHFDDPKVAAAAFIERSDGLQRQVLLVQRGVDPHKGLWALPAGFVDRGEDPRLAVVREALEETGLQVEVTDLIDVFFSHNIVIVYAAHWIDGLLQAGDDATDARWFDADNLPELAFESTQTLLAKWCKDNQV